MSLHPLQHSDGFNVIRVGKQIDRLDFDQRVLPIEQRAHIARQRGRIASDDHHPIDLLRDDGVYHLRPAARARRIEERGIELSCDRRQDLLHAAEVKLDVGAGGQIDRKVGLRAGAGFHADDVGHLRRDEAAEQAHAAIRIQHRIGRAQLQFRQHLIDQRFDQRGVHLKETFRRDVKLRP